MQASCQKYRGDKTAFSEYDSNYGGGGDGNIHEPQLVGTLVYISFYKMSLRGPPISNRWIRVGGKVLYT